MFNRLVRSRAALVADQPGLTRDRIHGAGQQGDRAYIVVDTGGLVSGAEEQVQQLAAVQVERALQEGDALLFLVDGRAGLTAEDEAIARQLRQYGKPVFLAVNKIEGLDVDSMSAEFYSLGFAGVYPVSAAHGEGVTRLVESILDMFPVSAAEQQQEGIKVAVAGRPNVGKSTLTNRILGEERVVTCDEPGTTRDSIHIPFMRGDHRYTLIDTAGVRRRSRVDEKIEKFSVVKTLQAIEESNIVILVLDARQGIGDQDARLLGNIIDSGRGIVIAVNKWDGLDADQRSLVKETLQRKLSFFPHVQVHFISALHGTGVGTLLDAVNRTYEAAVRSISTAQLTRLLEQAVAHNPPPLARGRRIKLRYAHQGGQNPPVIVIHGTQTGAVPASYRRYLANFFVQKLAMEGTPVRVEFRQGKNPYVSKASKKAGSRGRHRSI